MAMAFTEAQKNNIDPYDATSLDREEFKKRIELLAYRSGYELPATG